MYKNKLKPKALKAHSSRQHPDIQEYLKQLEQFNVFKPSDSRPLSLNNDSKNDTLPLKETQQSAKSSDLDKSLLKSKSDHKQSNNSKNGIQEDKAKSGAKSQGS